MANEFKDLQDGMAKLSQDLQGLAATSKDSTKGLDALAQAAAKGAKDVAKGLGSWTKSVGQGDTSFSSLNGVVDIVTNALADLAKAIPVAGEGLAQAAKAAGEAGKFMLDQLDQTTKAFNDLGKVGALTADGMTGLQRQFTQSGLPLGTYTKIIGENSQALASWSGVTGQGAESFSKIVGSFTQGHDDSLRLLGMNAEQIGKTTAAYVTQQTRLGQSQRMTNDQLVEGTRKYALELDQLQKITGLSADNIQKQQDAMLSESRFRANIDEMVANGDGDLAKVLQDTQTQMASYGSDIGKGFADLVSGAANTTEAAKLMNSSGGAAADIVKRLKEGKITQAQANDEMLDAFEKNRAAQQENAKYVDKASSAYIDYAQLSDAIAARQRNASNKAVDTQKKQLSGTDKLTKDTVSAQKNMEAMSIEMQKLGFTFLPNAAAATRSVSNALKAFLKYLNKDDDEYEEVEEDEYNIETGVATGNKVKVKRKKIKAPESETEDEGAQAEKTAPRPTIPAAKARDIADRLKSGAITAEQAQAETEAAEAEAAAADTGPVAVDGKAQVETAGLKVRPSGDIYQGGKLTDTALTVAQQIQANVPGFQFFTGLNDAYHEQKHPNSKHALGRGMDFVLSGKPAAEEAQKIQQQLAAIPGVSLAKNEYFPPPYGQADQNTTGPHFHVQTSAASGAILSGPTAGYQPNSSMQGVEAKPLDSQTLQNLTSNGPSIEMFTMQLEQLDQLLSSAKQQLSVKEKLLKYKT
jgi:hypothetical protein